MIRFAPHDADNQPTLTLNQITGIAATRGHLLIIFRIPHDPRKSLSDISEQVQKTLATHGFGNFSNIETTIGLQKALILNFDKPQGAGTWSCRHYFLGKGTLGYRYTLGFGTTNRTEMFELYDLMAKSFEILGDSPPPQASLSP